MSFDHLTKDKKREILNISIKSNEHLLYESLIRLGIDPSSFDVESFDIATIKSNQTSEEFIKNLIKSISSLKFINKEMQLLGE
jgi:hypothetical protein